MKVLGLDVGEKRIGVAKADSGTRIAVPVGYINVDGTEWEQISHIANLNDTKLFVLGLPRSNDGNETAQSLYVRNFAKTLTEKIPSAKIRFQDESLTSVEAEKRLKSRKKNFEKGEIDAEAASIILQDFIEHFSEQPMPDTKTNIIEKNAQKAMLNSKKVAKKSKKLASFIITPITLVFLAFCAIGCLFWYHESLSPVVTDCDNNDCSDISFSVTDGDPIDTIAKNLKDAGLIRSAFFFKIYLKIDRTDAVLKSGSYNLNRSLSVEQIVDAMIAGTKDSEVFRFTILPGETLADIKAKLVKIEYDAHEVEDAFSRPYGNPILASKPAEASLEGYLFGETHEFFKNTPVTDIIEKFLAGSEKIINENNLVEKFAAQGLSLHEGIILASVVQREAYPADQANVAKVFYNRLHLGIMLGSDVTASYAADLVDPERHTYTTNYDVLNIDSCYNTRKYAGLPCGAIASPSLSALMAVANPAENGYIYFLTGDDGKMYYGYTEAEHNQNIRNHCQSLCNVAL